MFPKVNRDSYGTLPIETDDLANYSTGWFPSSQTVIIYSHYIVIICHYVYNCIYIYDMYMLFPEGTETFPNNFQVPKQWRRTQPLRLGRCSAFHEGTMWGLPDVHCSTSSTSYGGPGKFPEKRSKTWNILVLSSLP